MQACRPRWQAIRPKSVLLEGSAYSFVMGDRSCWASIRYRRWRRMRAEHPLTKKAGDMLLIEGAKRHEGFVIGSTIGVYDAIGKHT